ncbi:HAD hydrolase-like protein [Aureimonas sp. ME7]|uniref:HAD hydrolase-like protein n=1 Tax=Aureimonas sp. ME7 TaxID=2744252 RepID=UPI0015F69649|nr:HAD hydrolase-like protein [Aureimonas sp. ME7]
MSVAKPIHRTARPFDRAGRFATKPSPHRALRGSTIVFDLDGTLVDTAPDLTGALNHCLAQAGVEATTIAQVRPDAGRGARAMLLAAYERAGRLMNSEELVEQTARFLAFYAEHIAVASRPFPGAVAALDRLVREGATLAICTNKTEALALRLLAELELADRFAAICGADTFAERKPNPVHLASTVLAAGGSVERAVMIGDTDTDMEAAHRLSMPSVLLDFGYDPDACAREKASVTVSHFDGIDPALMLRLLEDDRRHDGNARSFG